MTAKIALITGGSRGIGANAAIKVAERGIDVIITYFSAPDKAEAVVKQIEGLGRKAAALELDLGKASTFDGFVAKVKDVLQQKFQTDKFNFLVNNAGASGSGMIEGMTEALFDSIIDVHLKGPFFLTQKLLPIMADGGRILNTSSGLTRFTFPGFSVYAAAKAAIETMTKYQAKELGSRGIAVNVLAPGPIDTDMHNEMAGGAPGVKEAVAAQTALGRYGVSDDAGMVVAAFLSEETRWINAQRIEFSGGFLC